MGDVTTPVVDPGGVCTDPEVLKARLNAFGERTAKLIAEAFETRAEAKAACGRSEHVVEIHGLAGFFVRKV